MTVKELIEMLETCDKESIVYINCGDDINSIDEIYMIIVIIVEKL